MRKALVAGTALALLGAISPSHAAQETFEFFINGNATGDTTGPTLRGTLDAAYGHNAPEVAATVLGVFYPLFGGITFDTTSSGTGAMSEASATGTGTLSDAFDGYGTMQGLDGDLFTMVGHFGGLNGYFQTDASGANGNGALPQNTARWLHSFVNNTGSTIVMPMGLFNNVGSDGNTKILTNTAGMLVTMQGSSPTDPVILHLYGNNGLTQLTNNNGGAYANGDDNPMFQSTITVQPGQAVSLMHIAMLFGDVTRTGAACNDPVNNLAACESGLQSDVALANSLGASYLLNPALLVGGLTPAQINSIVNWNLSGVLTDMSAFGFSAAMTTTPQLLHGKLASDLMGRLAQLREVGRLVGDEDEQESAL